MHSNLVGWLERIEKGTLPALPQSIAALSRLVPDDNTPLPAYADVIEKDPALTLALLRRVRTLRTRRLNTEITTVEHALMLLGLAQVRALIPTVPLLDQAVSDASQREQLLALYARANHAAYQAQAWARVRKDMEPDEVQCVTLLHGLAEMLLWLIAPAEMRQVDTLLKDKKDMPRAEAYYVVFGFSLEELTAELAERWGLPSLLHESLLAQNAGAPRVSGIMLAVNLARACEQGWYRAEITSLLEQIAEHLRMGFDATVAFVHGTSVDAARTLGGAHFAVASRLLHPSQPAAARGYVSPVPATELCVVPQPHLFRRALYDLQQHEASGMAFNDVLQLTTEAMHEGIGLDRVVFAHLSKDHGTLKAHNVVCPEQDPHFSRFEVELRAGDLLDQIMGKPQALWLNETNRERFIPLLSQEFLHLIGTDSFFLLSVFLREKPFGLFYADRHHSTCALDAPAYHQFKQLGLQAARTLAGALSK